LELVRISWPKQAPLYFADKIRSILLRLPKISSPVYNALIPSTNRSFSSSQQNIFKHNEVNLRMAIHNVRSIVIYNFDISDVAKIYMTLKLQFLIHKKRQEALKENPEGLNHEFQNCIN
jgi:hypothetical protein